MENDTFFLFLMRVAHQAGCGGAEATEVQAIFMRNGIQACSVHTCMVQCLSFVRNAGRATSEKRTVQ